MLADFGEQLVGHRLGEVDQSRETVATMASVNDVKTSGTPALNTNPVQALSVGRSGELRPMYGGRGISDMRTVSGELLLSLQNLWRQRGDEILYRVADGYPELIFSGMIKLAKVTRIEVGSRSRRRVIPVGVRFRC